MWPLSLMPKKQVPAGAEPAAKECRVCWGGDEDGEEDWVAPCRCPRTIAWVHRRCLAWRLKHTKVAKNKLRCAVCKHVYKKRLRLKSLREWRDGWAGRQLFLPVSDLGFLYSVLYYAFVFRTVGQLWEESPTMAVFSIFLANASFIIWLYNVVMARRAGYPSFYKSFLAVAVRDRVLDAPNPLRGFPSTTS